MSTLRKLQSAIRAAILAGDETEAAAFIIDGAFSPSERLDVYRNTSVGVLVTALRLAYPAVHRLVGAEFFEGAARVFIAEHPPRGAWLDAYGAEFAAFLDRFPPAASLPYLADVARLERLVNRALHAPDAEPLDLAHLVGLDEAQHGRVRFAPHPSLGLLGVTCPADAIWHAVLSQDDAALAVIDPAAGPAWLLVERLPSGVDVTRMSEAAWRFTAALCAGEALRAASLHVDTDAAALLAEHLAAGRFIQFELAERLARPLSGGVHR